MATVNPCGFAMLPSFIAYCLGSDAHSSPSAGGRVADGLLVGLTVSAGFMLVFSSVGIAFALGARAVLEVIPWLTIAIGAALIGLGMWLLAGKHLLIRLPGLGKLTGSGHDSMFAFGIAYAVGSLSCTLPIFVAVIGSATATGSLVGTLGVFLAYGLGMATVLMLLSVGTAGFRELVIRAVRPLRAHMERISGALLVLGGGYVVFYWTSLLGGSGDSALIRFVQDLQTRVQELLTGTDERLWFAVGAALLVGAVLWVGMRRAAGPQEPEAQPGPAAKAGEHRLRIDERGA